MREKFLDVVKNRLLLTVNLLNLKEVFKYIKFETLGFIANLKEIKRAWRNWRENNYRLALDHFQRGNFADVRFRLSLLKLFNSEHSNHNILIGLSYFIEGSFDKAKNLLNDSKENEEFAKEYCYALEVMNNNEIAFTKEKLPIPVKLIAIRSNITAIAFDAALQKLWHDCAQYALYQALKDYVNFNRDAKVLDLGCGTGILGLFLQEDKKLCNLTGVDISSCMIDILQQHNTKSVYTNVIIDDMNEYIFHTNEDFDVIALSLSLNFVSDIAKFLKAASNKLKTGGTLALLFKTGEGFDFTAQSYLYDITEVEAILTYIGLNIVLSKKQNILSNQGAIVIASKVEA